MDEPDETSLLQGAMPLRQVQRAAHGSEGEGCAAAPAGARLTPTAQYATARGSPRFVRRLRLPLFLTRLPGLEHEILRALVSLLATSACGPAPVPLTTVTIWWEFDRNTLIDGAWGIEPYDTAVNWPPGTGSRGCPMSGVDYVVVYDGAGVQISPPTPCVTLDVQGTLVTGYQALLIVVAAFIGAEQKRWKPVIARARIKPD